MDNIEKRALRSKILCWLRAPGLSFLLAVFGIGLLAVAGNVIGDQTEVRRKMFVSAMALCLLVWSIGTISGLVSFRNPALVGKQLLRILALIGVTLNVFLQFAGIMLILGELLTPKTPGRVVTAHDKELIRTATDSFQLQCTNLMKALLVAAQPLTNSPILNFAGISNVDGLRLRETNVRVYIQANENFSSFWKGARRTYRRLLASNGVDTDLQQILVRYELDGIWEKAMTLRSNDSERSQYYLKALNLLETNWGDWSWKPESPHVHFDDDSDDLITEYNEIIRKINSLYHQELESQAEISRRLETNAVVNTNSHRP